ARSRQAHRSNRLGQVQRLRWFDRARTPFCGDRGASDLASAARAASTRRTIRALHRLCGRRSRSSHGLGGQLVAAMYSTPSFAVELRSDGVAIVRFDLAGESLNTLKPSFAQEFSELLGRLERDVALKAVVFTSGKADSFIAGADIRMLDSVSRADEATELSRAGQRTLNALSAYRVPVVAAIHGPCLGGGLELALACSARVASSDPKTKLGVPEVQLGILPALGGTQRLPRLVGLEQALDLLLTGKQIDATRALGLGLIDELVPKESLLDAAVRLALSRALEVHARKS